RDTMTLEQALTPWGAVKASAGQRSGLGLHESVPKCVVDFLEIAGYSTEATYGAACLMAGCVPVAEKDGKLPEPKRKELSQKYAERSVAFLRQAIDKGGQGGAVLGEQGPAARPHRHGADAARIQARQRRLCFVQGLHCLMAQDSDTVRSAGSGE